MYVEHPRISRNTVEERGYQTRMVEQCVRSDTLLILPTGLGKTVIAVRLAAEFLDRGKILILAPTKPLAEQHASAVSRFVPGATVSLLTGLTKESKRAQTMEEGDIVVSTPQTVDNDLTAGRYNLCGFSLIVYDEAHRGRGDYAYVRVAQQTPAGIRSVGMTASPGNSVSKIEEVCVNLHLRKIIVRTESDPDVSPYIHDTFVNRIEVSLPEDIKAVSALLRTIFNRFYEELRSLGYANNPFPTKSYLISVGNSLQRTLTKSGGNGAVYRGLTLEKICIQLMEAISKAESEGMTVLRLYLDRLEKEAGKKTGGRAAKTIIERPEYAEIRKILDITKTEHPKISRVMSLVSRTLTEKPASKVLVFAQFRDACDMLSAKIETIPEARVGILMGQSNGGLKQREQIALLEKFRSGEINVLISTSVGEEGLDVSNTDTVIFYEPVPSEIRTIQRRGRTGRKRDGEVHVLVALGTVDEAYERSSIRKEKEMRENLEKLSEKLSLETATGCQTSLDRFVPPS